MTSNWNQEEPFSKAETKGLFFQKRRKTVSKLLEKLCKDKLMKRVARRRKRNKEKDNLI